MARRDSNLTCRRAETLLEAFLDGDLAPQRRAALEAHLAGCFVCGQELAHARRLRAALRDLPPRFCDDMVLRRALDRVRDEPRTVETRSLGERWRAWLGRQTPRWQPAAAVLAVAVALGFGIQHWVIHSPREQTFTAADVARAEVQVKWVLGHLGEISKQTTDVVRHDVIEAQVAEPATRAATTALQDRAGLGSDPGAAARPR